jgi:hypothetical protein
MRQWKLYLIIVPSLVFLLFATMAACSQPPATIENQPVSQKPAEFEVGPITFEPSTVMVGDPVTATATVKNIGDVSGTYTAILAIDGQEMDKKDITVEPGNSTDASFQFSKANPGTYNIIIGDASATINVHEWKPYKIQYDETDETGVPGVCIYVSGENGHIVRFTPPAKAFRIQKIRVFGTAGVLNNREYDENYFTVRIWDKEGNNQLWSQDLPWRLFFPGDCWREIKVPDVRVNDDFYVEIVTHSIASGFIPGTEIPSPGGHPIEFVEINEFCGVGRWQTVLPQQKGPGVGTRGIIVIGFEYPKSYTPSNHPETRSGYSYMGKPIDPGEGRFEGINWLIRVEGEGAVGN